MSILKFNPRNTVLLFIILVVAALRLLTDFATGFGPLAAFTPIGAMALFGGAYFNGYLKPFAFPLFTLFISDLILSFTILSSYRTGLLYQGWYWTYTAFALMALAGKLIVKHATIKHISFGIITVVLIHWLVSDIGGCLHEKNFSSMLAVYGQRLITAIPFELRFLGGTILYSAMMFGTFEWMQKKYPQLAIQGA
ncbi:MAG TPA: DUF6580 family putative transport protein [Puia sp.]|nr:DUF6580 family putative transport protein [Puia sp.]